MTSRSWSLHIELNFWVCVLLHIPLPYWFVLRQKWNVSSSWTIKQVTFSQSDHKLLTSLNLCQDFIITQIFSFSTCSVSEDDLLWEAVVRDCLRLSSLWKAILVRGCRQYVVVKGCLERLLWENIVVKGCCERLLLKAVIMRGCCESLSSWEALWLSSDGDWQVTFGRYITGCRTVSVSVATDIINSLQFKLNICCMN